MRTYLERCGNILRDYSCTYYLKSVDFTKLYFLSELSDQGIDGNLISPYV